MKYTLNKILAILLTLIMILNAAPFTAYAEEKDNPPDSGSFPEKILLRGAAESNSISFQLAGVNSLENHKDQYNYYVLLFGNSTTPYAYGQLTKPEDFVLTPKVDLVENTKIWIVRVDKTRVIDINNFTELANQGEDATIKTS